MDADSADEETYSESENNDSLDADYDPNAYDSVEIPFPATCDTQGTNFVPVLGVSGVTTRGCGRVRCASRHVRFLFFFNFHKKIINFKKKTNSPTLRMTIQLYFTPKRIKIKREVIF